MAVEIYDESQSIDPIDLSCCVYNFASLTTEIIFDEDEA